MSELSGKEYVLVNESNGNIEIVNFKDKKRSFVLKAGESKNLGKITPEEYSFYDRNYRSLKVRLHLKEPVVEKQDVKEESVVIEDNYVLDTEEVEDSSVLINEDLSESDVDNLKKNDVLKELKARGVEFSVTEKLSDLKERLKEAIKEPK